jgi:DNA-binding beta-propeller fold protein YncE
MKKHLPNHLYLCIVIVAILCLSTGVLAEVEWDTLNDVDLQETPLDIAVSRDGMTAFILCEKSIKLYSIREGKVTDTIPITARFSQLALSPDGQTLLLTDTKNKQLSVIRVTPVYDIKIGLSPVIGKADAPVTVFAFMDYQ